MNLKSVIPSPDGNINDVYRSLEMYTYYIFNFF